MMEYPASFVRRQRDLLGEPAAADWLARIPAILASCAQRWDLTIGPALQPLTYNYLARARVAGGTPAVLKVCTPGAEFVAQAAALRHFDGHGAVRLLASDPASEVMLLEWCAPGTMLRTVEDDEQATAIAAEVMRRLWRPAPPVHPFPTVADWGKGFERMRAHFGGGSGPFPAALTDRAERLFGDLAASMAAPVVLHGDLHHDNVLAASREPWLVIDPKGVVGEPAYETATFMLNRLPEEDGGGEVRRVLARRIAQLSETLDLDRQRVHGWALSFAVLSAWWNVEDTGRDWEGGIALAQDLAALRFS